MSADKAYSVYVATNARRREAVVGVADAKDVKGLREELARMPPLCMTAWRADETVEYRIVDTGLGLREALAAAARRSQDGRLSKMKVRVVG